MPRFYATVELSGPRGHWGRYASGNPTAGFVPGIRGEKHPVGELSRPRASLPHLQNSRTDSGFTYLELHYVNHLPKVVYFAMKSTRQQPTSAGIQIGEPIRAQRRIVGMTQGDLARRLGVSLQQIQKYQKGPNRGGAGRLPPDRPDMCGRL